MPQQFEIGTFTWNKRTRILTCEASSLRDSNGKRYGQDQNSDGNYINIKGTKSTELFEFNGVSRSREGELEAWYYRSKTIGIKVIIFND